MRPLTILVLVPLLMPLPVRAQSRDFAALFADKNLPDSLKPQSLNKEWRKVTLSHVPGDTLLLQMMAGRNGADAGANLYYTKGQIVQTGGENYLVAYRPRAASPDTRTARRGVGGAEIDASPKLEPDVPLALCLLNLREMGNMTDITPFDPARDIEKPVDRAEREGAQSMTNLKQIGLGLLQYVQDYDERLPPMRSAQSMAQIQRPYDARELTTVQQVLQPYLRSTEIFEHPKTRELYRPNSSLSGKNFASFGAPARTATFYEASAAADKKRAVLFLDGHVKRVAPDEWERIKKFSRIPTRPNLDRRS